MTNAPRLEVDLTDTTFADIMFFAELLSQHGWDDESIIDAFENHIAYLKSKEIK